MTRKYTAFISYRHLPLDTAVAERLHRLIERYRVPRDLRKDRQKHMGLVFRDRDELPLSNDLTQDIYDALDHSEYLIVICTPDTPKSLWVQREIQHFLSTHDRNRVLTVLVSGTVAESVPECITSIYGEDGVTVIDRIEPLCAFLVDENRQKVLRNLKSEFLRLAAAIIGCPYDSLKQRQKRYRIQRAMLAFGVIATVALAIIVLLIKWNLEVTAKNEEITAKNKEISGLNEQIQDQLTQTLLSETNALTLSSQLLLSQNDRRGAIKNAMAALSSSEIDRPYSVAAHAALAKALYVYQEDMYRIDSNFSQPEDIDWVYISDNARYIVTIARGSNGYDIDNRIHCYDAYTQQELWYYMGRDCYGVHNIIFEGSTLRIICGAHVHSFDIQTGKQLSVFEHPVVSDALTAVTKDNQILALSENYSSTFFNLATGEILGEVTADYLLEPSYAYDFKRASHSFSEDVTTYAILTRANHYSSYVGPIEPRIVLIDTESCKIIKDHLLPPEDRFIYEGAVIPLPSGGFAITYSSVVYEDKIYSSDTIGQNTYVYLLTQSGELTHLNTIENRDEDWDKYQLLDTYVFDQNLLLIFQDGVWQIDLSDGSMYYESYKCVSCTVTEDSRLMLLSKYGKVRSYAIDDNELRLENTYKGLPEASNFSVIQPGSAERVICCTENNIQVYQLSGGRSFEEPILLDKLKEDCNDFYRVSPSGNWIMSYGSQGNTSKGDQFGPFYHSAGADSPDTCLTRERNGLQAWLVDDRRGLLRFTDNEDKVVIDDGLLMDINTGALSSFDHFIADEYESFSTYESQYQRPGDGVLNVALGLNGQTLHWWIDGMNHQMTTLPQVDNTRIVRWSVGHNGLILIELASSDEDANRSFLIYSISDDTWKMFCPDFQWARIPYISNTKQQFVLVGKDDQLHIYHYDSNAILYSVSSPVPYEEVRQLYFIKNSNYLLIITRDQYAIIADLHTGETKFSINIDEILVDPYFYDDAESNLLYFRELVIDMESWTVLYEIPGMIAYLPSLDAILCNQGDHFEIWSQYTLEDLLEFGEKALQGS